MNKEEMTVQDLHEVLSGIISNYKGRYKITINGTLLTRDMIYCIDDNHIIDIKIEK